MADNNQQFEGCRRDFSESMLLQLFLDEVKSVQLHAFGDASESSYGACVYLRCEHESDVHCNLVTAKMRVAPMTNQTIPRLELLSCLVAARLLTSVKEAISKTLTIEPETMWTDSTTALHWIRIKYRKGVQGLGTEQGNRDKEVHINRNLALLSHAI